MEEVQPIAELCRASQIEFIDYSNRPKYVHHAEYFKDGTHMNAHGADEYTRDIVSLLKWLKATE